MISKEAFVQVPITVVNVAAPTAALEFDARWAAWVVNGRVHERVVRRKAAVWGSVLLIGTAVAYLILR